MSMISLAGTYTPPTKKEKLCWGDIHRARAPIPVSEPVYNDLLDNPTLYVNVRKTRERKLSQGSRFVIAWTDEMVEKVFALIKQNFSYSQIAREMNKLYPQENERIFTRCTIAGKVHTSKAKRLS